MTKPSNTNPPSGGQPKTYAVSDEEPQDDGSPDVSSNRSGTSQEAIVPCHLFTFERHFSHLLVLVLVSIMG
jgi:hypothetical protein